MKLPHRQVKHGHFGDIALQITAHFAEMFYTFRYRVENSGGYAPKLAIFSCSSGTRISFNALKNKRTGSYTSRSLKSRQGSNHLDILANSKL